MAHSFHSSPATLNSAWMRSTYSRSPSTRRRAESSCCSSSPKTDGIRNLHRSDNTTAHHSHGIAGPMPHERNRGPQARKDNSYLVG
jgi:hypothetical protein